MRNTVWQPNTVDDKFILEKISTTDRELLKRAIFLKRALQKERAFKVRAGELEKFSIPWYNYFYAIMRINNLIIHLFNRNGLDGKQWFKHTQYMFRGPNENTRVSKRH
jgi:hypothetical protein